MQELLKKENVNTKYREDIEDSDFIGVLSHEEDKIIIVKNENDSFVGIDKNDNGQLSKWTAESKKEYVKNFSKVFLFDSEIEMMLWYNNTCK